MVQQQPVPARSHVERVVKGVELLVDMKWVHRSVYMHIHW